MLFILIVLFYFSCRLQTPDCPPIVALALNILIIIFDFQLQRFVPENIVQMQNALMPALQSTNTKVNFLIIFSFCFILFYDVISFLFFVQQCFIRFFILFYVFFGVLSHFIFTFLGCFPFMWRSFENFSTFSTSRTKTITTTTNTSQSKSPTFTTGFTTYSSSNFRKCDFRCHWSLFGSTRC
jgi:hypothetical protein